MLKFKSDGHQEVLLGSSDNDSLLGSSPGGGGLIPPEPIYFFRGIRPTILL